MSCSICAAALFTPAEHAMQTCAACAGKCGIVPMPPATRPPAPCQRCNGRVFVRAIPREHSSARSGEQNAQVSVPMFVTHRPSLHDGWVLKYANELEIENGYGVLELYICRGCGFVEWYCPTVAHIPLQPNMMTELVDYDAGGTPYR